MRAPMRRLGAALIGLPAALFLVAAVAPAPSAAHSSVDGAVLQGTWKVDVRVVEDAPHVGLGDTTWTFHFGEGCAVGEACTVSSERHDKKPVDSRLKPSDGGFRVTEQNILDCYDSVTGQVSTPGGAVYDMTAQLVPASSEVRDGVTYVTSMTGTMVETIEITAVGRADNCSIDGQGVMKETERSVLDGAPIPLPEPPSGTSPDPVGVDPTSASGSGTLPEFTLPRSDDAVESGLAVSEGRRSSVPGALVVPSDALDAVVDRLPQDLLLVAALALLMVFPAQIFNSTYEENHERIRRALARLRPHRRRAEVAAQAPESPDGGVPQGRLRRLGIFVGCAVVGTLLGGLLDPGFGADRASAALLAGVFVALLVAVLVAIVTGWALRSAGHLPHGWYLRAIPSALLVAVLAVVVSRLTHFEPGYLYGVLGGAVFVGLLSRRAEGRVEAGTLAAGLGVAVVAWVAFEPVSRLANEGGASFHVLVADSLLGCLFIGGIEGLLFSLVPLRFLPGYRVRQWGWVPWGVLTLVTTYLFVHVLLVPESGYLGRSTAVSVTVTLGLFVAFGLASCLFWAWFRLRPDPAGTHGPTDQPTSGDSGVGLVEPVPVAVPT